MDDNGHIRLADFGLMAISVDLSTIPLSATTVYSAGTVRWMSPELLFGQNSPPTCESDRYALGMVVYEVSLPRCRGSPQFTRCQVLTGLRPFHHLGHYAVVITVQKGERPRKPDNAASLGLSDTLWRLIEMCWSEPPSTRPTAQELLHHIRNVSHVWVPPPEYPISDDLEGGVGTDITTGDERSRVTSALAGSLFTGLAVLCVLLLQFT